MKIFLSVITCLLISLSSFAQAEESDTDAKYFFSAVAGLNFTQMQSSGDIYKQSSFGTGFKVGLQFNYFPDYEYRNFYFRLGASYGNEKSESKNPISVQQDSKIGLANINLATIEVMLATRFATNTKIDGYFGGGFQFQQKVNNDDDAYTFLNSDGTESPIFNEDDPNLPLRFKTDGPKAALGPFAELGAFVLVGDRLLGIATGVSYGFFFTNSSAKLKFEKVNLYITASYELF